MHNPIICPCCGNNSNNYLTSLPKIIFKRTAKILICSKCGCGFTHPQPILGELHYKQNTNYEELFTKKDLVYTETASNILDFIKYHTQEKGLLSLVDIACGGGFLVQEASTRGYDAIGVDLNENVINWAKSKKRNVFHGDISELVISTKYDVIVLSHILEHLENPADLLTKCKQMLSNRGIIVVSQTDYNGILPKIFPWLWYGWQPVEHYWHFTPKSMDFLAQSVGLKIEKFENSSIHHSFQMSKNINIFFGKNLASLIGKIGIKIKKGDAFNAILTPSS